MCSPYTVYICYGRFCLAYAHLKLQQSNTQSISKCTLHALLFLVFYIRINEFLISVHYCNSASCSQASGCERASVLEFLPTP